jgi:hypothetical protein
VTEIKYLEMTLRNQIAGMKVFLAVRTEYRLKFLRKIPGRTREVVTGGSRKLHNGEF